MPYIDRDENNNIIGVYASLQKEGQESVDITSQEYLDYISPPETYLDERKKNLADGGYGTWQEQFEIMNEQGFAAWQTHCAAIKTNIPKP